MRLIVYFDYTCSYSYAAALWLREVEQTQPGLACEWRPFMLKAINRPPAEAVHFWEQPGVERTRAALAIVVV